jgi:hypoxia up-regulated 1
MGPQQRLRIVAGLALVLLFAAPALSAVVGLDLGSEFFKVVLVKPGSMDVALNEASGRKTPTAIGFTEDERLYGEPATTLVCHHCKSPV